MRETAEYFIPFVAPCLRPHQTADQIIDALNADTQPRRHMPEERLETRKEVWEYDLERSQARTKLISSFSAAVAVGILMMVGWSVFAWVTL